MSSADLPPDIGGEALLLGDQPDGMGEHFPMNEPAAPARRAIAFMQVGEFGINDEPDVAAVARKGIRALHGWLPRIAATSASDDISQHSPKVLKPTGRHDGVLVPAVVVKVVSLGSEKRPRDRGSTPGVGRRPGRPGSGGRPSRLIEDLTRASLMLRTQSQE